MTICRGYKSYPVGVYCQTCPGIPLAVRFVGRDRLLWNSMVQGTQWFRQVRAASCIIPYVLCGGLYCLRCWCVSRGSLSALIYPRDRFTWKVLAEYNWSSTIAWSGSFLCTATSSTPIRVVYKRSKVHLCAIPYSRTFYAYEQSRCPGSDKPLVLRSRVLQASST